jgi:DNA-binding CsgD family transcriptional regulator
MNIAFSSVLTVLESLDYGAVVVRSDGEVIAKNDCADRVLRKFPGLIASKSARNRFTPRRLTTLKTSRHQPMFLHIGNARPILVLKIPLHLDADHAVFVLVDTNKIKAPRTDILQIGFGLTQCEATLAAALSAGKTLKQIAKLRGVGIGTVRGQLKSVFVKTATARQPELVAMLSRLAVAVDSSEPCR